MKKENSHDKAKILMAITLLDSIESPKVKKTLDETVVPFLQKLKKQMEKEPKKKKTPSCEYVCKGCGKTPYELEEYVSCAESEGISPLAYLMGEEGTLNKKTKKFYCTKCYIAAGMPQGTA